MHFEVLINRPHCAGCIDIPVSCGLPVPMTEAVSGWKPDDVVKAHSSCELASRWSMRRCCFNCAPVFDKLPAALAATLTLLDMLLICYWCPFHFVYCWLQKIETIEMFLLTNQKPTRSPRSCCHRRPNHQAGLQGGSNSRSCQESPPVAKLETQGIGVTAKFVMTQGFLRFKFHATLMQSRNGSR